MVILNQTKIYTDACVKIQDANQKGRALKGEATCGVLIIDDQNEEHGYSQYLGICTVPEAEFKGLILGLDKAVEYTRGNIQVLMDSELVIKWMNKIYRMKKDHIKPLYDKACSLQRRYSDVKYIHCGRNDPMIKKADKLANIEYQKKQKL